MPKTNRLTLKETKLVQAKVAGKTHEQAYHAAYNPAAPKATAVANTHKVLKRPHVQAAIAKALDYHQATPEYAVGVLKQVAEQDKEIGARRLAAKDLLELHGWNRGQKPSISIDVQNAFFKASRD